jgi:integrase
MKLRRLSARFCATAAPRQHPYCDGGNLHLDCSMSKSGEHVNRSWTFIYEQPGSGNKREGIRGKRRYLGLGSLSDVTIKQAREEARQCRELLRKSIDPLDHRRGERQANITARENRVTFKDEAERYIALHSAGWEKSFAADWRSSLELHAFAKIGHLPVDTITSADVLKLITPLWTTKTVTAGRVLNRIERIMDYATAQGHRSGDNPAAHITESLPKKSKVAPVKNLASLHYDAIPELMTKLDNTAESNAIRFLILTAARNEEVVGADWSEVDIDKALWTVPGDRMKARKRHRVPLSEAALACLGKPASGQLFPIGRHGIALRRKLKYLGITGTSIHGFRSSFRQWAAERTAFSRNAIELSLAHAVAQNQAEDAYLRDSDLLDQRKKLMATWAEYCLTPATAVTGKVVPLRKA